VPGWGDILNEVQAAGGNADVVRERYIGELHALTGRSTVVYATDFLSGAGIGASITLQDMQGLMEVFRGLPGPGLDLLLHSPGGQAEATDRLVRYMRAKYTDVRVFVPLAAMSAATMWALAANLIVMGKHSQLGPIDPQVLLGANFVPANALVRQFQRISDECAADPSRLSGWMPTLNQYWPGLLEICNDADELARSLVEQWVGEYMLHADPNKAEKAKKIADYFADAGLHKSHSKGIDRDEARAQGVCIEDLEGDSALQDAVLSVHHAVMLTLQGGTAVKLIENNLGRRFVAHQGAMQVQLGPLMPVPIAPAPQGP
jgi:hypothetical protein